MSLSAAGHTDVGRKRQNNEDGFALLEVGAVVEQPPVARIDRQPLGPRGTLLLVADGMGGAEAGEVASRLALEGAIAEMQASRPGIPREVFLRDLVCRVHARVQFEAEANVAQYGMGSTLAGLWLVDDQAHFFNVGDCRIYRWRDGELAQLTVDQTVAQSMVNRGEITPEQARSSRFRGMLEAVIGGGAEVPVPQVGSFGLRTGDRFLLCSDGCHDCLEDADFEQLLRNRNFDPVACAHSAVSLACRRSGHDNITVVAAMVADPSAAARGAPGLIARVMARLRSGR